MARKQHRNTAEAQVEDLIAAAEPMPAVPAHVTLRPEDMPFWNGIVSARATRDWTASELVVAAQLARCQQDIETESKALYKDGATMTNSRGTQIMNPRVTVLEQLARREMALMRALRIGGYLAGDKRDLNVKRQAQEAAAQIRDEALEDDDGLLAVPPAPARANA